MRDGRIGPFEVIAKLGGGGMADVYLAAKEGPGDFLRPVVVKVLRSELQRDIQFRQMFVDEARLAARIQHTNVVVVEDLGQDDGRLYMVMEYVHGVTLNELLQRLVGLGRRLSPAAAVAIATQALAGLQAAHEACGPDGAALNLVHRDISPQNVLLAANGVVKLIDFGIAKAAQRLHRTMGHVIKGKLRYMAPEQIGGEVDQQSDLYAMGVVLWEMLTGRRLFGGGSDQAVITRVRTGNIDPPSHFVDVPAALEATVMRTLAVEPALRPSSAKELRLALLQAVPEAREVEPPALSALLVATVGAELEDRARRLMVPIGSGLNTTELSSEPARAFEELTCPWEAEAPQPASGPAEPPRALPVMAPATMRAPDRHFRSRLLVALAIAGGLSIASLLWIANLHRGARATPGQPAPPPVQSARPDPAGLPRSRAHTPTPPITAAPVPQPDRVDPMEAAPGAAGPEAEAPASGSPRTAPSPSRRSRRSRRRGAFPLVTDDDPFADDF